MAQRREPLAAAAGGRWTIKKPPAVIQRLERAALPALARGARPAVRKHSVKAHQPPLGIVAAQRVEIVAQAIKRIRAMLAGPECVVVRAGADQPHAEAAVRFLVFGNPALALATGKNPGAEGVAANQI